MIDEFQARRPEWVEGAPLKLADGQLYHFPKPRVLVKPRYEQGQVSADCVTTYGPEFDTLVDQVEQAQQGYDRIVAMVRLGLELLLKNYAMPPEQAAPLFEFALGDEQSEQTLVDVYNLAVGFSPEKPTAAG